MNDRRTDSRRLHHLPRWLILVIGFSLAGAAASWWAIEAVQERGGHAASTADSIDPGQREGSEWKVVRSLLQEANQGGPQVFAEPAISRQGSAAAYVRGIELLVRGDGVAALAEFDRMTPDEVPGDLAYAPYRLQSTLRPDKQSAYASRILEAVERNTLPKLVAARVLAQEGRLSSSLVAYTLTDPAAWTTHDLECLRGIAQNGALRTDLDQLVWRALSRTGLDREVGAGLISVVRGSDIGTMEERFRRRVATDPEAKRLAGESLDKMREARALFMERRYEDLLERFGEIAPTGATSEMATVLFLAALSEKRSPEVYRWGQELKRRHPDPALTAWVADLTQGLGHDSR
jgi:hypothetical protein